MKFYNHFINGEWVEPTKNEYFDTENPFTGEVGPKSPEGAKKMLIKLLKPQKLHSITVHGRICGQHKEASF